jgi:hypothetical protein
VSFELFHGTTQPSAERILHEGWKAFDVNNVVMSMATSHGVDPEVIALDLASYNRFIRGPGRGRNVFFCADPLKAEHQWAQRAPEAKWEILWSIWRVKNGVTFPEPWNAMIQGHAWVWEQTKETPLAVIALTVTHAELHRLGALNGGFGLRPLPPRLDPKLTVEVAIPLPFKPARNRIAVRTVPRHVDWDVFAHLLNLTPEEFKDADRRGKFGPNASDGIPVDRIGPWASLPWWTTKHVAAYLASKERP